jgi:hypothetical protein
MPALPLSAFYDELLDLLVESAGVDRLLTFRPLPDRQAHSTIY